MRCRLSPLAAARSISARGGTHARVHDQRFRRATVPDDVGVRLPRPERAGLDPDPVGWVVGGRALALDDDLVAHCSRPPPGPMTPSAPSASLRPRCRASWRASSSSTSSIGTWWPSSRASEVTLLVLDAARDHLVEPAQLGVHVERQAVRRDPALHPHADRAELSLAVDPDAGIPIQALAGHAECRGRVDDRGLQRANVATQVERVLQLEDRVGHDLARPVEGDVAAAVDPDELGADLAQPLAAGEEVRRIATATEGVDGEVLEQQQAIADAPAPSLLRELVLQLPGRDIGDGAEPVDGQDPSVPEQQGMGVTGRTVRGVAIGTSRRRRRGLARRADVADHRLRQRRRSRDRAPARRRGTRSARAAPTARA